MRMPDDYEIPDDPDNFKMDAAYLRSCLGLRPKPGEEPPKLPLSVRRAHYDMARSLSILGATGPTGMTPTQLATVVSIANISKNIVTSDEEEDDEPKYSFIPEIESGRVEPGQKLVVYWRKKNNLIYFVRLEEGRIVAMYDGCERSFRHDLVRYPHEGEFPDAEEKIDIDELRTQVDMS